MKRGKLISAVAVFAACAVIAAFGCSRTKTIKTDEGEVTLDKKGDVVSVKTDQGTMTISSRA